MTLHQVPPPKPVPVIPPRKADHDTSGEHRGWDEEGHKVIVAWVQPDGTEYLIPLTLCCQAAASVDEDGHMYCKGCYGPCSPSCGMEARLVREPDCFACGGPVSACDCGGEGSP